MSTIGLDLGTSGVRAVAFDDHGRQLTEATARTVLERARPGWVTFDAESVLQVAEIVVATVSHRVAAAGDPVRAIAYCSQGEAVVPVDRQGRALAPMPTGLDLRGVEVARTIHDRVGAERVQRISGAPLHPMFSVYKIATGDDAWRPPTAAGYRTLGDFVLSRWGAAPGTDWTLAARTGLLDVGLLAWSAELLEAVAPEAPWVRDVALSDLVPPGTVLGDVSRTDADRLGVPTGTALVAGVHDQAASFIGAGGTAGSVSTYSLGSSDCLTVETDTRPAGIAGTGFATYPWRPGRWLTLAGTAAGGWALEWFAELTGFSDLGAMVADLPAEPPDVLVLPYLAGSGTLDNDPAARGAVAGLTLGLTRAQLVRAFVEAAGYELGAIRAAFAEAGIEVGKIRAVGSGASDPSTLAVRVDAAGSTLTPVPGNASARGAALLAACGIGLLDLNALPAVDLGPPIEPTPNHSDWYARQRRRYRDLYRALRPITNR